MKTYYVSLPALAKLTFTVEAETEKDAIDKALSAQWSADFTGCECDSMETMEYVVQGNVFYGDINEPEVEEG